MEKEGADTMLMGNRILLYGYDDGYISRVTHKDVRAKLKSKIYKAVVRTAMV